MAVSGSVQVEGVLETSKGNQVKHEEHGTVLREPHKEMSAKIITANNVPKSLSGVVFRHPPELAPEQKEAISRISRKKSCIEKLETELEPIKTPCFDPLVNNFTNCWAGMFQTRHSVRDEQTKQIQATPAARI